MREYTSEQSIKPERKKWYKRIANRANVWITNRDSFVDYILGQAWITNRGRLKDYISGQKDYKLGQGLQFRAGITNRCSTQSMLHA